ncbi:hypothetical protein [Nocardia alni]|uniref:hypothetical protein n=1 Tax=Nocardia alni TaxID=2815723 RepID=UPI001C230B4E|nr:hypothetical protein [Nocardia alni]
MTASGTGTDDSQWPNLKTQANDGDLMFNSAVAVTCYNACSTLLGKIESMMNSVGSLATPTKPLVTDSSDSSTDAIGSAANFRTLLIDKWSDLYNDLYQHKLIVTDMGETFQAAANAYSSSEDTSADTFNTLDPGSTGSTTIESDSSTVSPPDYNSTYGSGSSGSTGYSLGGTGSADLVSADSYATTIADEAEDGTSFTLQDFIYIGESITDNSASLSSAAEQWNSVQSTWDEWATTFHEDIQQALNSGEWSGSGASAAVSAVDSYVNGAVTSLGQTMGAMYKTIVELMSLLQAIYKQMPVAYSYTYNSEYGTYSGSGYLADGTYYAQSGCHSISHDLSHIQQAWTNLYPPGLQKVAEIVPAFSDPGTQSSSGASGTSSGSSGASGSSSGASGASGSSGGASGASGSSSGASGSSGSGSGDSGSSSGASGGSSGSSGSSSGSSGSSSGASGSSSGSSSGSGDSGSGSSSSAGSGSSTSATGSTTTSSGNGSSSGSGYSAGYSAGYTAGYTAGEEAAATGSSSSGGDSSTGSSSTGGAGYSTPTYSTSSTGSSDSSTGSGSSTGTTSYSTPTYSTSSTGSSDSSTGSGSSTGTTSYSTPTYSTSSTGSSDSASGSSGSTYTSSTGSSSTGSSSSGSSDSSTGSGTSTSSSTGSSDSSTGSTGSSTGSTDSSTGSDDSSSSDSATGALSSLLQNLLGASGVSGPLHSTALEGISGPTGLGGISGASSPGGLGGVGGGLGGGGALGPGASGPLSQDPTAEANQFPSASGASTDPQGGAQASRAGADASAQEPMMPMNGMGGAGNRQNQQKDRKRSSSLDSKSHLDEAIGDDPLTVRPIIER